MVDAVDVEPSEVTALGRKSLAASQAIAQAYLTAQDSFSLPEEPFGNIPAGTEAYETHSTVIGNAGTLVGRLVGVLEGDCDRLYQAAFHYQAADEAAAEQLNGIAIGGPISSSRSPAEPG